MTEIRRSFPSLLIYALGLAALMACDILASSWLSVEELSIWSRIRSLFYFYSSLILFGADQILIRRPRMASSILAVFRLQLPVMTLLVSALLHFTGYLRFDLAIATALTASLSSVGNLLCLGRDKRTASQFHLQAWKMIVLASVAIYALFLNFLNFDLFLSAAFGLAFLASAVPLLHHFRRPFPSTNVEQERLRWAYRLGRRYVITTSLAAMALYAEALLLNLFAAPKAAAVYFAHLTFFAMPLSALGGYLSFVGVPLMRRGLIDPARVNGSKLFALAISAAILTLGFQFIGWLAWQLVHPSVGQIVPALWVISALGAFLRLLYLPLSVYFSVYGEIGLHNRLIIGQLLAIAISALFLIVGISSSAAVILIAIPAAGLMHLALRVLFGAVMTWRHARFDNHSRQSEIILAEAAAR